MVMRECNKFEQVIRKITPKSRLLRTWNLEGGGSSEMAALEIEDSNGLIRKVVLRLPRKGAIKQNIQKIEREFKILQMTFSLGLPTQKPYYLDRSCEIFSRPYMVIEYIDGKQEFAPSNLSDYILQMATHLAGIHSVNCSVSDLSFLSEKAEIFDELSHRKSINNSLLSSDEGLIREVLKDVWPLHQRNSSLLLHGDFWTGNILWQDDKLVAIIDWEEGRAGDPLIDLVITRLDILCIFGIEAMDSFTTHYKSLMAIDYTDLPYWDLWAALRLGRKVGTTLTECASFFTPLGRADITEKTIRESYNFFITRVLGSLM